MGRGQITTSLPQLAKAIDHALLHPTMTDSDIVAGIDLALRYDVATVCVKPYSVIEARRLLVGSRVGICSVIGFPHGSGTTDVKCYEATEAARCGGTEIDMVVNVGKALSGDWHYVADEIRAVNGAVRKYGASLKVILETDYLVAHPEVIVRLCRICVEEHVAFVKTSTGFGFVKQAAGGYGYRGATPGHIRLMKQALHEAGNEKVQIKASGGVRTLDDMLYFMSLGATRIGTSATAALLDEAKRRGIGDEPMTVEFEVSEPDSSESAY